MIESRSYDLAGRPATLQDAEGRTTSYTYYADGLLKSIVSHPGGANPDVTVEQCSYDAAGNPTTVTTAGGRTSVHTYDPANHATSMRFDPTGLNRLTTNVFNLDGTVDHTTVTGPASPGRTERPPPNPAVHLHPTGRPGNWWPGTTLQVVPGPYDTELHTLSLRSSDQRRVHTAFRVAVELADSRNRSTGPCGRARGSPSARETQSAKARPTALWWGRPVTTTYR